MKIEIGKVSRPTSRLVKAEAFVDNTLYHRVEEFTWVNEETGIAFITKVDQNAIHFKPIHGLTAETIVSMGPDRLIEVLYSKNLSCWFVPAPKDAYISLTFTQE